MKRTFTVDPFYSSVKSLTAAKFMSALVSRAARYKSRPILPNPLIATFNSILTTFIRGSTFNHSFSIDIPPRITSMWNYWNKNYWDDWRGYGKYVIHGKFIVINYFRSIDWYVYSKTYRWLQFDWHPVKEPYDIQ